MIKAIKILALFSVLFMEQFASCNDNEQSPLPPDIDVIITNTNIIDVINKSIIENQTILIKGDTIVKIIPFAEEATDYPDSILIDGTGRYVSSGFWNMHSHICWKPDLIDSLFPTLLEYGITGVRDMGGSAKVLNDFKAQIKETPQRGPSIFGPGPILDGEAPIHPDFSAALTKSNVETCLDSLMGLKVDFFKVYSLLPDSILRLIASYSEENNITFAGHISEYVSPIQAIELGQKSIEHLNRIEELANDTIALQKLVKSMKDNHTWVCPTVVIYKRKLDFTKGVFPQYEMYKTLDPGLRSEWENSKRNHLNIFRKATMQSDSLIDIETPFDLQFDAQKKLVLYLYNNNIPILIGSDFAGMPFVYPGIGFHEEMSLLSEIGFNNFDILRMATYDAAVFLNINRHYGSVDSGKVADLIIFNKNPIEEIQNTLDIHTVIRAGKSIKLGLKKPRLY